MLMSYFDELNHLCTELKKVCDRHLTGTKVGATNPFISEISKLSKLIEAYKQLMKRKNLHQDNGAQEGLELKQVQSIDISSEVQRQLLKTGESIFDYLEVACIRAQQENGKANQLLFYKEVYGILAKSKNTHQQNLQEPISILILKAAATGLSTMASSNHASSLTQQALASAQIKALESKMQELEAECKKSKDELARTTTELNKNRFDLATAQGRLAGLQDKRNRDQEERGENGFLGRVREEYPDYDEYKGSPPKRAKTMANGALSRPASQAMGMFGSSSSTSCSMPSGTLPLSAAVLAAHGGGSHHNARAGMSSRQSTTGSLMSTATTAGALAPVCSKEDFQSYMKMAFGDSPGTMFRCTVVMGLLTFTSGIVQKSRDDILDEQFQRHVEDHKVIIDLIQSLLTPRVGENTQLLTIINSAMPVNDNFPLSESFRELITKIRQEASRIDSLVASTQSAQMQAPSLKTITNALLPITESFYSGKAGSGYFRSTILKSFQFFEKEGDFQKFRKALENTYDTCKFAYDASKQNGNVGSMNQLRGRGPK